MSRRLPPQSLYKPLSSGSGSAVCSPPSLLSVSPSHSFSPLLFPSSSHVAIFPRPVTAVLQDPCCNEVPSLCSVVGSDSPFRAKRIATDPLHRLGRPLPRRSFSFLVLFRPLLTSDISQAGAMLSPNPWTAELAAHVSVLAMAHCPDTLRDRSWANPKAAPKLTLLSFVAAALQGPTTLELPVSAASLSFLRRRPC